MANPTWPAGLPQYVEAARFAGVVHDGFIETEMEAGPPRRVATGVGGAAGTLDRKSGV